MINIAKVYVKKVNKNKYQTYSEYSAACASNLEDALKKFKRQVIQEGILKDCRDRMYYKSKSVRRKEMEKAGRRKHLRQMRKQAAFDKKFD